MSTYAKSAGDQRYTQGEQAAIITADGGAIASVPGSIVTKIATGSGFKFRWFPAAGIAGEAVVRD